jgi:hypothetical protein
VNRHSLPLLAAMVVVVAGCGQAGVASSAPSPRESATASPSLAPSPSTAMTLSPAPSVALCDAGPGEVAVHVPSQSNLFGSGSTLTPAPGGGGGGVSPPLVDLPGGDVLVTFPCVEGLTDCCEGDPSTGPSGTSEYGTDVESTRTIAGLVMDDRSMFLAGVFLTDDPPKAPPPDRLDLTGMTTFDRYTPALGQTFYIGDGVGQSFVPPDGATRLYLGFVDARFFQGEPGFYANNRGSLDASVLVAPR